SRPSALGARRSSRTSAPGKDDAIHPRSLRGVSRVARPAMLLAAVALLVAAGACSNKKLPAHVGLRTAQAGPLGSQGGSAAGVDGGGTADTGGPGSAAGGSSSGVAGATGDLTGPGASAASGTGSGASGATSAGSGAAGGSTVGVTKTSIKIAVSAIFSGVSGPIGNGIYDNAAVVWANPVNGNGGI